MSIKEFFETRNSTFCLSKSRMYPLLKKYCLKTNKIPNDKLFIAMVKNLFEKRDLWKIRTKKSGGKQKLFKRSNQYVKFYLRNVKKYYNNSISHPKKP